jgi:hypothetical protein
LPTFKESEVKDLFDILDKFLRDLDSPISKEQYLATMQELGQEPDYKKIPLGFEDIPNDCQLAFNIYSKLGNRVYGDVGFTGKDYTNLPILIEIYHIWDKDLLLDLLNSIDAFNINKNQKQIKKMYDDMKKKK